MSKPLTSDEITWACAKLPGWAYERESLTRTFKFGSFREALSFMVRIGFEAEELNHHPEWTNVYNRVAIRLNTHDAGVATRNQKISWVEEQQLTIRWLSASGYRAKICTGEWGWRSLDRRDAC